MAVQTCKDTVTPAGDQFRFTDNMDGIVKDSKTGLTWMKCTLGQEYALGSGSCSTTAKLYLWSEALQVVKDINDDASNLPPVPGSNTDWRVPNIKELASIVETSCTTPAIKTDIFGILPPPPEDDNIYYLTASVLSDSDDFIYGIDFDIGSDLPLDKATKYYVRLVRGINF